MNMSVFLTAVFVISFFGQEVYACNTTEYVEAYDSDIEIMSHLGYADDNDDIPYSNSYTKCWLITTTTPWEVVKLQTVTFDLEYRYNCSNDFLTIYNSASASGDYVTKCGFSGSFTIYTSGQHMFLEFQTDAFNTYRGFKLTVSQVSSSNYDFSLWTNTYESYDENYTGFTSTDNTWFLISYGVIIGIVVIVVFSCAIIAGCVVHNKGETTQRGKLNIISPAEGRTVAQQGQVSYTKASLGGAVNG